MVEVEELWSESIVSNHFGWKVNTNNPVYSRVNTPAKPNRRRVWHDQVSLSLYVTGGYGKVGPGPWAHLSSISGLSLNPLTSPSLSIRENVGRWFFKRKSVHVACKRNNTGLAAPKRPRHPSHDVAANGRTGGRAAAAFVVVGTWRAFWKFSQNILFIGK